VRAVALGPLQRVYSETRRPELPLSGLKLTTFSKEWSLPLVIQTEVGDIHGICVCGGGSSPLVGGNISLPGDAESGMVRIRGVSGISENRGVSQQSRGSRP
jgi:hypothetical protein